jgi:hypothetical protein
MKKIGISFFLAASLLMSGITAHAAGTGDNPNFTKDVPTETQKSAIIDKERAVKEWKEERNTQSSEITPMSLPDGYYKTIAVPSFEQQTSYWCGPATTKQVLHYLNGSSSSQSTIASGLGTTTAGTDFSLVDNYLNSKQSKNYYVYSSSLSYGTWSDHVNYGLDHNYPVVLDLEIYPSYMPKYTTHIAGHILNVSGADSRFSPAQIRLTDPYDQGNRGVTLGNVWHSHKGVYDANMDHFRQASLW